MVIANVIGGAGRMGEWFAKFLKTNGYTVTLTDSNSRKAKILCRKFGFQFSKNLVEAAVRAEVIIVATPTKVTSSILQQLAPILRPNTLVIEISSIKRPIIDLISKLQRRGIAVLSIHPMFGPGASTLKGRCILVATKPEGSEPRRILGLFRKNGARTVSCSLNNHDMLASTILTLPHFINVSFIETLRSMRVNLDKLSLVAGTTFQLQLLLAEAIYNEDYNNEVSILGNCKTRTVDEYNRQASKLLRTVKFRAKDLAPLLRSGRRFVKTHEKFSTAYRRFNAAVQESLS